MPENNRAFTLIEVLVVIAILGLLVAILMPSLSRARASGRTLVCLTHLRQLSNGWVMYADDNNGVILPGRMFKQPGGTGNPANWYDVGNGLKYRPRWMATMGAQVGVYAFNEPSVSDDRQDYDNEVYRCPEARDWIDERNYAYGYNHQFLGNARRTNDQFHHFPVRLHQVTNYSGTVIAGDCMGTAAGLGRFDRLGYDNGGKDYLEKGNHGWTLDPPRLTPESDRGTGDSDGPRTAVDPRHVGKVNVAFADAHGETMSDHGLGYRKHEDGRYVDLDPFDESSVGPPHNRLFSGTGHDDDPPDRPQASGT